MNNTVDANADAAEGVFDLPAELADWKRKARTPWLAGNGRWKCWLEDVVPAKEGWPLYGGEADTPEEAWQIAINKALDVISTRSLRAA